MGMEENLTHQIQNLDNEEISILLKLYYNKDGFSDDTDISDFGEETLHNLLSKNLIQTSLDEGNNSLSLSDEGLNIIGSVMFNRINEKKSGFKSTIQTMPQKTISCLVNRIMWKDTVTKETGVIDEFIEPYSFDQSMWFERVLLQDLRIANILEQFYRVLEDFDLVQDNNGQRFCSPEVEGFLKEEFKGVMDLSWTEEDSLKYYFFFYVYAADQKNLINFTGAEEARSRFFGEDSTPPDYWFSAAQSNPRRLLPSLDISEKHVLDFLSEMQSRGIVNERYYPLNAESFFSDEDIIFVIQDIKAYMDFINGKFLNPVVNSLIS